MSINDGNEMKGIKDTLEALSIIERVTKKNGNNIRLLYDENPSILCLDMILLEYFEQLLSLSVLDHCRKRGDFVQRLTYVLYD
jgi:hypothetical protein